MPHFCACRHTNFRGKYGVVACYNILMLFRSQAIRWATVLLILIAISPTIVFAGPLDKPIVPCNGTDCTFCHIAQLAQNILNAGIYIAVFLSAILFAYAGWTLMTAGGEGKVSEARKIFSNVTVGLILILAAWLIVDLIMKILVNQSYSDGILGPWNEVCPASQASTVPGGQPLWINRFDTF